MKKLLLLNLLGLSGFCGCVLAQPTGILPQEIQPEKVRSIMMKVADWQLANPSKHHTADWTHGALYAGMTAWAQMTQDDKYYEALAFFGEKNNWQPHSRPYHADDHTVGQMYIELYKKYRKPEMIRGIQERFDWILAHQPDTQLEFKSENSQYRYSWCDALFMAPPVWAKLARVTGERKYLDYMNKEWWATTDYLFDAEENLYFRDSTYFKKREANGKNIFWSRGNGWVFAGLARVLEELPDDYPDRGRYEELYRKMAAKLIAIQPEEGLWHPSLLDTVSFPSKETSGSGFYCYGLAWGINHGLLDENAYLPAVIKAWSGLTGCVHPDGKLGYVQPIGAMPRHVESNQTEIYGVGAFLLAGSEVYKIALRNGADVKQVVVTNPAVLFRDSETVNLKWDQVKKLVPGVTKDNIAVFDFKRNRLLVTQVVSGQSRRELLFQTDFAPGEKKYFWVMKRPAGMEKPQLGSATFCRFVPEREDDFAWENDLIAFRMYGPALWDDAVNSGVDCWLKRVDYPVIDKWYGQMNEKTYHTDWGEGYDPYHVGKTAGCGGLRIMTEGQLLYSNVYDSWKVIENGPIRSVFELTYDKSWKASGRELVETKHVTINLGQRLCRFDCSFTGKDANRIEKFAVGISTHDSQAQSFSDTEEGIACCWEKIDGFGLGTGVLVMSPQVEASETLAPEAKDESHIYLYTGKPADASITYYLGYGWERAGDITTVQLWKNCLESFRQRVDNPVKVRFVD